jgi:hypothetical protein
MKNVFSLNEAIESGGHSGIKEIITYHTCTEYHFKICTIITCNESVLISCFYGRKINGKKQVPQKLL